MYEEKERCIQGFWWGNLREREHLEDPGADGRITLKNIQEVGWGEGMDWIDLVQNKDRWQALVNVVMNPQVP